MSSTREILDESVTPSLSELTTISLAAAIELDKLLRNEEQVDQAPLHKLSDTLRNASMEPEENVTLFLSTPATLSLLNRALTSAGSTNLKTIKDLNKEIAYYVKVFSETPASVPSDEATIKRSLDFCISLHRELVSEVSQYDSKPPSDE